MPRFPHTRYILIYEKFEDKKKGNQKLLIEEGKTTQSQMKRKKYYLQNISRKTKDLITQTPLYIGVNSTAPEGLTVRLAPLKVT